ncbi:MAG: efflux RND transporter permease subunit [Polyangiaceae bacterium]|nr:efflux RND transporter permease subunit [Polyangiaceae bacterium]
MQWLAAICVRRPVFASVIALVLTVLGTFAYFELGVDRFPKVEFPVVMAVTVVPGASPEQVETEVTDKIESAVNTISGIDELRSVSVEGVSQVIVSFVLEKDINVGAQEVREKINEVLADLPTGIDPPVVAKLDPDATPILTLAVTGAGSARDITELADKVVRREIESLNGVGQVTVVGGRARQINVWVDPAKLEKYDMSGAELERALRTQNIELPSGRVEKGETQLTLRTLGRVQSIEQLADVTVGTRSGQPIRLRDVAQVEDGTAEAVSAGFRGTHPTVLLNVRKQSGTNTVEVVRRVKDRMSELGPRLPKGTVIDVARDQSEFIGNAIATVKEHLVIGALLAAVVVFLFLRNWRSTLIAAVAIPVSIISTFALMRYAGFNLNVITMLGLTLAVGIVIDDAIVVLENIYRHMEEKGSTPFQAAIEGTKEIGLAVLATTLSLVAVFLPVAFMGGIVGRFMNSFGLTMAFSIMVSLLVSFVLTPMMCSRWLRPPAAPPNDADAVHHGHGSKASGFYLAIERLYMRMLGFSMRRRWVIVLVMLATLLSIPVLGGLANKNFLPEDDESQLLATLRLPEGASLDATRIVATRVAGDLEKIEGVKYAITTVGDDPQKTPNLASIYVKLVPVSDRKRPQSELIAVARDVIAKQPGAEKYRVSVGMVPTFSGGMPNYPVVFQLQGPELSKLEAYSRALMARLARQPGVKDPDTSMITGKPEVRALIDRKKAADLGVNVADVAGALRLLVGGYEVSTFNDRGEQYDVKVRSVGEARNDVSRLKRLSVPSAKLGTVTLDNVVTFDEAAGPSRIDRFNRRKTVTVMANLAPGFSEGAVLADLATGVDELKMDPAYSGGPSGRSKELGRTFKNFMLAFVLSFIFMYLVLAAQFESWLHPITILLSLPLTVPFALISVIIFGQSLNIFSMLGILVLFGIVKKNSILQIDHTIKLRAAGMPKLEAILAANRDRLRPILMTTAAFVAGMLPLVVSTGAGAGTNRATGFVIIGGQTLALLLTLLATPVAYSLFDDLSVKLRKWFRIGSSASPEPKPAE